VTDTRTRTGYTDEELARWSRAWTPDELAAVQARRALRLEEVLDTLTQDRSRAMVSDWTLDQIDAHFDHARWESICGARRSGKTTSLSGGTLIEGEERPGHMTIITAPTKEWLVKNYWGEAESGIQAMAARYGIELDTKENELSWTHQNGSRGVLMGLKDQRAVEALFGMEANRYIIDEAHRVPLHLYRLAINKSITPQAVSRKAQVIVAGNPGDVCAGDFWKATDPKARAKGGTCYPWQELAGLDEETRLSAWSFHHMSQQGNTAMPHQWAETLASKRRAGMADDDPTWIQQGLGLWVHNPDALRFKYDPQASPATPGGSVLYSLGVWLTEDVTYYVMVAYDIHSGHMAVTHQGVCDAKPGSVVQACRLSEAKAGPGGLAWMGLGSSRPVSDVMYDWYEQRGLPFTRFRKSERASYQALVNGALGDGVLSIPGDSELATQLSEAPKGDGDVPGFEFTDALLVAVGLLPAPTLDVLPPKSEEAAPRHPWDALWLPPTQTPGSVEEDPEPEHGTWGAFLKAHDWKTRR
jgi:hypothetical protein